MFGPQLLLVAKSTNDDIFTFSVPNLSNLTFTVTLCPAFNSGTPPIPPGTGGFVALLQSTVLTLADQPEPFSAVTVQECGHVTGVPDFGGIAGQAPFVFGAACTFT